MRAIIEPSRAFGSVTAPPSKSMAHRMLICAGLSKGESTVHGIATSQDVLATLDCLEALGAEYTYSEDTVKIKGIDFEKLPDNIVMNCRECGSTLRFFIPTALFTGKKIVFRGSGTLMNRPLVVYEDICRQNGFLYEKDKESLTVRGNLKAGKYTVKGNISSQFISGLLFALPMRSGDSVIELTGNIESRSYINMTIQALAAFGINISWTDEKTICIKGGQKYRACKAYVEGDYSNAAFFDAFNLTGGEVNVLGLSKESIQGDRVYAKLFKEIRDGHPTIDISDCPDLGPILFAAAAMCKGAHFTGTKRLKIKESDRAEAMKLELAKFGIKVELKENEAEVFASKPKRPKEMLDGHNDHRIVMSLCVIASKTGAVINGAQAVRKSFPDFFDKLKEINIEVKTDGMDK